VRRLAPALFLCVAHCAVSSNPALAQETLMCGVPLQRTLQPGAVDTYTFNYPDPMFPDRALVEAVDTSGKIGLLKLNLSSDPAIATCSGTLDLGEETGVVEVSDCLKDTASQSGTYTITLNVVSDSPGNCGIPLPCSTPVAGSLDVPGQVNAYTFPVGDASDQVTMKIGSTSMSPGAYHLRLFDPLGEPVEEGDTCDQQVTAEVSESGLYTALVSACGSPHTGPYTITWKPPNCPVTIAVGSVSGQPGQLVTIPVVLHTTGQQVTAMQMSLAVNPSTPIATRADMTPDCTVNPDIQKEGTTFAFEPIDCTPGVDCTGVLITVAASGDTIPIADGAELFSCTVQVPRDASAGRHPLSCSDGKASGPAGYPLFTTWSDGAVVVACTGDCNNDGQVTADELLTGVDIALGNQSVSACSALNVNLDATITVDEVLFGVTKAVNGCVDTATGAYANRRRRRHR